MLGPNDAMPVLRWVRFAPVPAVRYPTGLGEEDPRAAGDADGPPRTRRQVEMRQACLPVGQVAPVAPATYQGFVKR